MQRSFVITAKSQNAVPNTKTSCGEISFTVTNSTTKPMRGEARPLPLGATKAEWLDLDGERERNFSPNESHQITVRIHPGQGSAAGKYSFRLNMISVQDPEEDFTEGPEVCYDAKNPETPLPPPGKFPIWILFVILGVVLVGGGIAVALLLPKKSVVPEVTHKTFLEASNSLATAGFKVAMEEDVTRTNKPGTVYGQNPAGSAKAKAGATVTLSVEGQPLAVAVPDVVGMPVAKVKELFAGKDLKYTVAGDHITPHNPPPPGTIFETNPKAGALVDPGSSVTVTVEAPSVEVPDVRNGLAMNVAVNRLNDAHLSVGRVDQERTTEPGKVNLVVGQDPAPGTRIKPDQKVNLRIGVLRTFTPSDWKVFVNTNALIRVSPLIQRAPVFR